MAALAGCQESGFDESRETQRPLKVQHALDPLTGTKVPGVAERPMTLSADTLGDALALGVKPVRAALPGGRVPDYLRSDAQGVEVVPPLTKLDLAATEAAEPDVILGTKEADGDLYDSLKRIAPTVMSEGDNWKLNLRLHGEALGRTNDAEKLLIDWDNRAAKVREAFADTAIGVVLDEAKCLRREHPRRRGSRARAPERDVIMRIKPAPEWSGGRRARGPRSACRPGTASLSRSSPAPSGAPLFCRLRQRRMSTQILDALSRLAARRFGSFADAATDVLDLLESTCPGGSLALGQVDWDEGSCRMIDARGDVLPRGTVIPLSRGVPATGSSAGELLDGESLAALGPANWVGRAARCRGRPRRRRDARHRRGRRRPAPRGCTAAARSALDCSRTSGRASRRARSCRRLAGLARDRTSTDPVTGLPNRETLLAAIEREWELSKRGTVESYVVVCHVRDREALIERYGEAMTNLLLKDVAEVLGGAIRRTDYLARVSPDGLCAVLVGCKGPEGALAFLGRAERALERATEDRPASLHLSHGIQRLADAESTNEALELAEISARTSPARHNGTPLGAAPAKESS